jgi:outer membrane protein assembly factor BamB
LGEVVAIDAWTGDTLWKTNADGVEIQDLTAGGDGNLYMRVDDHIESLDGGSGAHLWSGVTDEYYMLSKFVVTNSALYEVESIEAGYEFAQVGPAVVIRALQTKNGREIWRQGLAEQAWLDLQANEQSVYVVKSAYTPGSRADDAVTLMALKASDGSSLWSVPLEQREEMYVYLADQTIYVSAGAGSVDVSGSRSLSAYQSQNGARLWSWNTPLALTPSELPDRIFGASQNKGQTFCALRQSDGSIAWCANYNVIGPVLFGQGRIYMVGAKIVNSIFPHKPQPTKLYILDEETGNQVAQYSPGDSEVTGIEDIALS